MQKADRGNNEHAILDFDVGRSTLGVRRFSAKLINIEHAELTADGGACLRVAIAQTTRANEALAGRTPHDLDGNRRHAALHCARIGHRNFLWLHSVVSTEDIIVDRSGLGLPLQ